jgi:hypothetical protein
MIALPERAPGRVIAAVTLLFACAYAASLVVLAKPDGRIVLGDALHHYVQLRSAVFDRDLKFTNEYLRMYGAGAGQDSETEWIVKTNATGHIRNFMPVGPAVLWSPIFLLVTGGVWLSDAIGLAAYPLDGYGRVFQASAGFSGVLAAGLGAWFAYLAAASLVSRRAAIWATLAVWLASSALYYSVISPTYSHAASMLAVSAFWLAFVRTRDRQDVARYALLGALAGAAALMRWQDAILIGVPVWEALRARPGGIAGTMIRWVVTVAAAAIAFAPQSIVWQRLYGHPLTIPQGVSFMKWGSPALWQVLFSDNHGLFSWTPVLVLAAAGAVLLIRADRRIGVPAAAFLIASWYVNASVADWWGGEAFGGRRFVACFPVFVLGTAMLFERLKERPRVLAAITVVFVALNGLLLVQYQTFMHGLRTVAPYPSGFYGLYVARFVVPVELARRWLLR